MEEIKQAQSEAYALTSIAISLKRIADVICRPPPIVVGLDDMSPEMREEWEKANRVLSDAYINKFK